VLLNNRLSEVITLLNTGFALEGVTVKKRLLPGVLLLLADHNDVVRSWALRHESLILIRPEDFPHIVPVFRRWYKVSRGGNEHEGDIIVQSSSVWWPL
jgi:hypothetical protein